jgi:dTDP-4-dehydrorhamnose 3,5-epimerase
MIFRELRLSGALLIRPEKLSDDRGFFARTWCREEFRAHGLVNQFVQGSVSVNPVRGTLRGLHLQRPPHAETKLLRCTRGAVFDVIVDLRPDSPTFREWLAVELTADSYDMLYVPEGFAHGFQTLRPETEVDYLISPAYEPAAAAGVRFDDPLLGIEWPLPITRLSQKDCSWPLLQAPVEPRGTGSGRRTQGVA